MIINHNLSSLQAQRLLTENNSKVDSLLGTVETGTIKQLADVRRLRKIKILAMKRELERLKNKLGERHARVLKLAARLEGFKKQEAVIHFAMKRIEQGEQTINQKTWAISGQLLDKEGNAVANKLIALTDADEALIASVDSVKTDENGYYDMKVELSDEEFVKMEKFGKAKLAKAVREAIGVTNVPDEPEENWKLKNKAVFVAVLDDNKKVVERDLQPLVLRPGTIDTSKIVLGASRLRRPVKVTKKTTTHTTDTPTVTTNSASSTTTTDTTTDPVVTGPSVHDAVTSVGKKVTKKAVTTTPKKVVKKVVTTRPKRVVKKVSSTTRKKVTKKTTRNP